MITKSLFNHDKFLATLSEEEIKKIDEEINRICSNAGKELSAKRKQIKKNCIYCKQEFVGLKTKIYCNKKCGKKSSYYKIKAKLTQSFEST